MAHQSLSDAVKKSVSCACSVGKAMLTYINPWDLSCSSKGDSHLEVSYELFLFEGWTTYYLAWSRARLNSLFTASSDWQAGEDFKRRKASIQDGWHTLCCLFSCGGQRKNSIHWGLLSQKTLLIYTNSSGFFPPRTLILYCNEEYV